MPNTTKEKELQGEYWYVHHLDFNINISPYLYCFHALTFEPLSPLSCVYNHRSRWVPCSPDWPQILCMGAWSVLNCMSGEINLTTSRKASEHALLVLDCGWTRSHFRLLSLRLPCWDGLEPRTVKQTYFFPLRLLFVEVFSLGHRHDVRTFQRHSVCCAINWIQNLMSLAHLWLVLGMLSGADAWAVFSLWSLRCCLQGGGLETFFIESCRCLQTPSLHQRTSPIPLPLRIFNHKCMLDDVNRFFSNGDCECMQLFDRYRVLTPAWLIYP